MEKDSILVNDSWIDSGMVSVAHFSRGLGLHRRYRLVGFSLDYESLLRSGKVFCYGFVTDLLSLPESIIHIIGIFQQFFRLLSSSSVLSE